MPRTLYNQVQEILYINNFINASVLVLYVNPGIKKRPVGRLFIHNADCQSGSVLPPSSRA